MKEYQPHKYANIFPMMGEKEHANLYHDIKTNGYRNESVIMLFQNRILDGRNRYKVCRQLGLEPVFVRFEGTEREALDWSISVNLNRRQLSDQQRSVVAAEVMPLYEAIALQEKIEKAKAQSASQDRKGGKFGSRLVAETPQSGDEPKPKSRDQAAELFNVSPTTVQKAKKLKEVAPDLYEKVKTGEMGVWEAANAHKKRSPQETPTKKPKFDQSWDQPMTSDPKRPWLAEALKSLPKNTLVPEVCHTLFNSTPESRLRPGFDNEKLVLEHMPAVPNHEQITGFFDALELQNLITEMIPRLRDDTLQAIYESACKELDDRHNLKRIHTELDGFLTKASS